MDFEVVYAEEDIASTDAQSNQNRTNNKSEGNKTKPIAFSALKDMLVMRFVNQVRVAVVTVYLYIFMLMDMLHSVYLPAEHEL